MKCLAHFIRGITLAALALIGGICSAQARTEIIFWHAMDGQLGDAVSELVKQFNQSQPEFEVKAMYKGTYAEVQASAMSAYRQKASPHIAQVYEVGTLSMMLSDAIVPVQRLLHQQGIEPNWGDFMETVTGYYAKEGKLASMPFNASTAILYYNKDIFRKAGLGDTPPTTWQAVEVASKAILASGAASCGFTTSWPSWTLLENTFAWHDQPFATNQNGYSGLDTKLLINGDFGLMHVGAIAAWQKERIFSYGGRLEEADNKFINRDCAMLLQSSGSMGSLKKTLTFNWGTGQLPHWGAPYAKANSILGGATLWVMRGHAVASYKGVAQFLSFVAEPAQQSAWAATTGYLPITRLAVKSLEEQDFYRKNPEQWTGVSQLLNDKPSLMSRGLRLGNYTQVRQAIEMELESIFAGKKTVKEGLDAAVLRGNAILRQFGVSHGAAGQGEI
jgi:sn-glycerol 3-phosphate transport system substrate-binding protein